MIAEVDRSACIGCGLCMDICPEVFRLDSDEKAEVLAKITPATAENARAAVESCPACAIKVHA